MHEFWHSKMRERAVSLYSVAPFLEETGSLLLAASHLWHPWSVARQKQLQRLSYSLRDRAKDIRQCGLAWASNISEFGESPGHILSGSVEMRYYGDDPREACPNAAQYLVSAAIRTLFSLVPVFKKIEESWYEEKRWVQWTYEIIEVLMEAPYRGTYPEISEELLVVAGERAIFLECETLATIQAMIEDSFVRKHLRYQRKKKSRFSDDQMRKLADDLGVTFETMKEVFEADYSSWWDQAKEYVAQAQLHRDVFVSNLYLDDRLKLPILAAWVPGMAGAGSSHFECWNEEDLIQSEKIIKTLIAMFLDFDRVKQQKDNQRIPIVTHRALNS